MPCKYLLKNQNGQSLLELLVAMAVFILVVSSIMFLTLDAHSANQQGGDRSKAALLAQAGTEASRSIKQRAWKYLSPGSHGLTDQPGYWEFTGMQDSLGKFTRQTVVSYASRDASGNIVQSGGTLDLDTKKVTTTVKWDIQPNRPGEVALDTYISNWRSLKWLQTTADFMDSGTKNQLVNTGTGELVLAQGTGSQLGSRFLINSNVSVGNMSSIPRRTALEFTAQHSATVTAVSVYLNDEVGTSPLYRYGLQVETSGQPSGTWLGLTRRGYGDWRATTAGWQKIDLQESVNLTAGQVYYIVVQYQSGTINNSNYISLRATSPQNLLIPFDNAADANSTVWWNSLGRRWSNINSQPIYVLSFSDNTAEGNPYAGMDESTWPIYGARLVGEYFVPSSAVKVKDINFSVRKTSNGTPGGDLIVTLRDETSMVVLASATLVTRTAVTTSYAYYSYAFSAPIELTAGRPYRVYLSSSGSMSTNPYRVRRLDADSNNAIHRALTYGGETAMFTASANGSTWASGTSGSDIGGYYFTLYTGYAPSGDFISEPFNTQSSQTVANYLSWTATVPAGTTLRFRFRTADTQAHLDSAVWTELDGTAVTYGNNFSQVIADIPTASGTSFVQYRAYFTSSDGTNTPTLSSVTLDYEI